jgi:tetratricopeptide (TPR) repeat protein
VACLGGLPLAIELAAAGLERATLEGSHALEAPSGDPPLARTIAWSWASLPAHQQRTLAELSVCHGGFGLDTAEAVAGAERARPDDPAVIDALHGLVRQRLVSAWVAEGEPRFSIHEAIRAFAARELERSGSRSARDRHSRWFGQLGASLHVGPSRHAAQRRGHQDAANLRVALARGLETGTLAALHDALGAALGLHIGARAVDVAEPVTAMIDAAERAGLADARLARLLQCRPRATDADLRRSLELARVCGERDLEGFAHTALAAAAGKRGLREEAANHLETALEIARQLGDPLLEGRALLVRARWMRGSDEDAAADGRAALALLQRVGDGVHEAIAAHGLAVLGVQGGAFAEAKGWIERALGLSRASGTLRQEAAALGLLGLIAHELGELGEARDAYAELRVLQGPRGVEELACGLAWLHLELGDPDAALAIGLPSGDGWSWALPIAEAARAVALARSGALEEARAALAVAGARPCPPGAEALPALAAIAVRAAEMCAAPAHGPDPAAAEALRAELTRVTGPMAHAVWARAAAEDVRALETRVRAWTLDPGGAWFRPPQREPVDVSRRAPLARLLAALVAVRDAGEGGLSVHQLAEAGWPGEILVTSSARNRVQNAVSTLRSMGLEILVLEEGVYRLDPTVPIRR